MTGRAHGRAGLRRLAGLAAAAAAAVAALAPAASAQGNLRNAQIESRPAADLAATVQTLSAAAVQTLSAAAGPLWIAYAVPAQDPQMQSCCGNWGGDGDQCCRSCRLEDSRSGGASVRRDAQAGPVRLEAGSQAVVLYRVEGRAIQRVRAYSESCELDAGGRTVHWLTGVDTSASIDLLLRLADREEAGRRDGLVDGAIAAIAVHGDPAADRALAALLAPSRPLGTRKQAAFWAGVARGRAGFELARTTLLDTTNPEPLRKHLTFVVSQSREAESVPTLTSVAKNDGSSAVRGEAIFWLGQKAGRQAAAAITDAIANDPDTKVKERAVFALSQLPKDDGVPKLIEVARSNRNPAVRKQAIFWLGESRDPRALAFFEEVLARR